MSEVPSVFSCFHVSVFSSHFFVTLQNSIQNAPPGGARQNPRSGFFLVYLKMASINFSSKNIVSQKVYREIVKQPVQSILSKSFWGSSISFLLLHTILTIAISKREKIFIFQFQLLLFKALKSGFELVLTFSDLEMADCQIGMLQPERYGVPCLLFLGTGAYFRVHIAQHALGLNPRT